LIRRDFAYTRCINIIFVSYTNLYTNKTKTEKKRKETIVDSPVTCDWALIYVRAWKNDDSSRFVLGINKGEKEGKAPPHHHHPYEKKSDKPEQFLAKNYDR